MDPHKESLGQFDSFIETSVIIMVVSELVVESLVTVYKTGHSNDIYRLAFT